MLDILKTKKWLINYYNPWIGCERISKACENCWYNKKDSILIRTDETMPREGYVFICNRSDYFMEQAADWRTEEWNKILRYSNAEFLLVTKRADKIAESLPDFWGLICDRCSIAITVEHSDYIRRLEALKYLVCANRIVFLSPLLSYVDLEAYREHIDFVVVSEDVRRPSDRDMVRRQLAQLDELGLQYVCLIRSV